MTTTADSSTLAHSSLDDEWAGLPDAVATTPQQPDDTTLLNAASNVCPVCGDVVERVPGSRGRLPKYHPECRPTKSTRSSSPRTLKVSKAEEQAAIETERILEHLASRLTKAVMLLAIVEPYDALVLRIGTPDLLDNLRPVLMRYDKLRAFAGATDTGGSVFGLVMAIASIALPIAAHHKLIPSKRVAQFLLQAPMFMLSIQKRMADGNEETLTDDLMKLTQEKERIKREAHMRARTAEESVSASDY